jgi:tetratricopeptide (TPR) repeat protein
MAQALIRRRLRLPWPVPVANAGEAMLARGEADAAIAKFTIANQKGPHFADPLEGWGEALMAKNQSRPALAKFAEAEKYAPNWGRLHLKWGEALAYARQLSLPHVMPNNMSRPKAWPLCLPMDTPRDEAIHRTSYPGAQ